MGIRTVKQRADLKRRREPYWSSLGTGRHVGYRVTSEGGTWLARVYDASTKTRQTRSFGDLSNTKDADRYTEAVKLAQEFFDHMDGGGRTESLTVAQAWQNYIDRTREDDLPGRAGRPKRKRGPEAAEAAAVILERRFKQHVAGDPIAKVTVEKLKQRHVEAWVKRLTKEPAAQSKRGPNCRAKTPPPPPKPKTHATINRDMGVMKAALNLALHDGYTTTDKAWSGALAPIYIDDKEVRRDLYLTRDQRKALLHAIDDASLRAFVEVLCRLPLRPGAVAALEVRDLKNGTLTIRKDKGHSTRTIDLSDSNAAMLRRHAKDKLPRAPLLTQANGKPWNRHAWKKPFKAAVLEAELPPEATAYTLRHSGITDMVDAGVSSYEIAHIAGTSARMIEKHYFHSQASTSHAAQDAVGW